MQLLLAILLALGVPFATLHTEQHRTTCCCPDPDHCKCPDHQPDKSGHSQMRACHKQNLAQIQTELVAFTPPPAVVVAAPAPRPAVASHRLPSPHAEPQLRRPDAPS